MKDIYNSRRKKIYIEKSYIIGHLNLRKKEKENILTYKEKNKYPNR